MATVTDIWVSAGLNISSALLFLLAFTILRMQPINDRFYFTKWYVKGLRTSPGQSGVLANSVVNLDPRSYIKVLNWLPDALRMPESELIDHAGLDSAVFLRIYLTGLKIFIPITLLALAILVPVNYTNDTLAAVAELSYSHIDKMSISNVPLGSPRIIVHITMAYVFTSWACFVLYKEYEKIALMRLHFLATESRCPHHFTVLVRNVPPDEDESTSEHVEHFFLVNHPDHYLTHQVVYDANHLADLLKEYKKKKNRLDGFQIEHSRKPDKRPITKTGWFGLRGEKVDAIDYYTGEVERLTQAIAKEREKLKEDPALVMPAAFVSFRSRWATAVCSQTQQTRNPTTWLTEWAPEPRDVYWPNLAIPYVKLSIRKLIVAVAFFFLTFFSMIPITAIQSLASIEELETAFPSLKDLTKIDTMQSFIQGFLPGLALKIFLLVLPSILTAMAKFEGFISLSSIERSAASKFYLFNFVNTFLGSIITGTALDQLKTFLKQSPNQIPKTIGVGVPIKATFYISFIMVDGWAGIAGEVLRLTDFAIYHLKNFFLVKTEKDMKDAMNPRSFDFQNVEPQLQLYILLGLVYAAVTPILLPFILVFFAFAYLIYRHQKIGVSHSFVSLVSICWAGGLIGHNLPDSWDRVINVYNQEYESAAAFWPDVHRRIVTALVVSHVVLIGLLSTKQAAGATPFLAPLPILTIWFHRRFCRACFEPAFYKYPLQEAMMRDTLEQAMDSNFDIKAFLQSAYIHPAIKDEDEDEDGFGTDQEKSEEEFKLVPTRRMTRKVQSAAADKESGEGSSST